MTLILVKPGTDEWLDERRVGIGASDAAAVVGLDPYRSALDVWAEKCHLLPAEEPSLPMQIGLLLEPMLATLYQERTGNHVRRAAGMHQHAKYHWMRCTIDRYLLGTDTLVELKTAGHWASREWGEAGTDEVPFRYIVQCQHQMAVTDRQAVDLAVLLDNREFRIHRVDRDEAIIDDLTYQLKDFWEGYVVPRKEPPVTGRDEATLRSLYPADDGSAFTATPDNQELIGAYADAVRVAAAAKEKADLLRVSVIDLFGDQTTCLLPGDEKITYKAAKPSTSWKSVAQELAKRLHADDDLAACIEDLRPAHGSRRLVLPRSWREERP